MNPPSAPFVAMPPSRTALRLVKGDFLDVSDAFGYLFTVFSIIATTVASTVLKSQNTTRLEWAFLIVSVASAGFFLRLHLLYRRKARNVDLESMQ